MEKKLLNFDLIIPKLRIDATYNLKGNILLLPLVGSGTVAMSMKDVKSSVYTKFSIKKKPEVSHALIILNKKNVLIYWHRLLFTMSFMCHRRTDRRRKMSNYATFAHWPTSEWHLTFNRSTGCDLNTIVVFMPLTFIYFYLCFYWAACVIVDAWRCAVWDLILSTMQ